MSKIGAITGGIGDLAYIIPTMKMLGITTVYVKRNFYPDGSCMWSVSKPLVESQGIECLPTSGAYPFDVFEPGLKYDYNLDAWRMCTDRGRTMIQLSMMHHFGVFDKNWRSPWLKGIPISEGDYTLFFLTWRWRENSKVDWKKVYASVTGPIYFVGIDEDYELWLKEVGPIERKITPDLLQMAHLVAGAKAVYCNQGIGLVLAQGLGKEYYCAYKPGKTNCMRYTLNEHNLNLIKL